MVEYATLADLRRFNSDMLAEERASSVKKAERLSPAATFLSHSSKDGEYLPGLIKLLESHGANVYVDKKDDKLPVITSRETAKALRSRITQSKKFMLFATKASADSRWIPWELGLADGIKKPSNTAIFPGLDSASDTTWAEREYLAIYDRVVWGKLEGFEKNVWMVWDQESNSAVELSRWLKS